MCCFLDLDHFAPAVPQLGFSLPLVLNRSHSFREAFPATQSKGVSVLPYNLRITSCFYPPITYHIGDYFIDASF